MSGQMDLGELWQQVQEELHKGDINRSLWDAAAVATPLVLEEDVLVLGLAPVDMRHASYLTSTANRPQVQQAVATVLGRRVDIRTVEGTTVESWEHEKEREAYRAQTAEARLRSRMAAAGIEQIWADMHEGIGQAFGGARERRFALSRARMVASALRVVREAEGRVREADPEAGDVHEKEINRAIDRIAVLAEIPATIVAIEHLRMKSHRD